MWWSAVNEFGLFWKNLAFCFDIWHIVESWALYLEVDMILESGQVLGSSSGLLFLAQFWWSLLSFLSFPIFMAFYWVYLAHSGCDASDQLDFCYPSLWVAFIKVTSFTTVYHIGLHYRRGTIWCRNGIAPPELPSPKLIIEASQGL